MRGEKSYLYERNLVLDLLIISGMVVFFLLSVAYLAGADRLLRR